MNNELFNTIRNTLINSVKENGFADVKLAEDYNIKKLHLNLILGDLANDGYVLYKIQINKNQKESVLTILTKYEFSIIDIYKLVKGERNE